MHPLQEKLLSLVDQQNIGTLTLRDIAALIGEKLPQKVKHHLTQLEAKGFIVIDKRNDVIRRASGKAKAGDLMLNIPIIGSANCGPAEIYANENIDGFLKISKTLLPASGKLYAIKADGSSMNRAAIKNKKEEIKSIESGDYVIVDSEKISPRDGDYVIGIIDGMANIKKYREDRANHRIVLVSESSNSYPPIFIHEDDDFRISGKVVDVVKGW